MDNALLIGLSRQSALRKQLDVIANNLANMTTGGFRAERMLFSEYLAPIASAADGTGEQSLSYVSDGGMVNDMTSGSIAQTDNPLDVAIDGKGWFVVNTPQGERYTRNGAFKLDSAGTLVTSNGDKVVSEGGTITFAASETGINISADGTVSSSAGRKDKLKLVSFADETTLQRAGETLFTGTNPQAATEMRVVQGAVERSNVRSVSEMTDLIQATRTYAMLSKMMEDSSKLSTTAINTLGQLKS